METLTPEQFKERYGEKSLNLLQNPKVTYQKPQSTFSRIQSVINNAGFDVHQAITGQGEFAGRSPITRGFQATAAAFNAVPQTALAASPEPIRQATEVVGNVVGQGFQKLTDMIGSNEQLQKWVMDNPEAANKLMEVAQVGQSAGQIAGTIVGADKTAKTLTSGFEAAQRAGSNVSKSANEAFGEFRPSKEQIAAERSAKITEGLTEQNERLKSVDAAFNKNTIVRKLPDGTEQKITPIDTLSEYDIAPVIEKGSIQMGDYKTGTGALGKIKENIKSLDDQIDTNLKNSGKTISIGDLESKAIKAVQQNPEFKQAGTVATNLGKIKSRFEDYRNSYGDTVDIAELNNIRKVANKDWKLETVDTSRVIGDVARDYVYDSVEDNLIKDLLQKQGALLSAKKYAEKLNGTKVTGGRIGNYAMRTGGAIIGSTVEKAPVIGPVAGMLGGEALARLMQQSQFKSAWTELRSLIAKD